MWRTFWTMIGLCMAVGAYVGPVYASTVLALSESALVQSADLVALGKIERVRNYVDLNGQAFTRAEFRITRGVVGPKAGFLVTLEVPGGKLANGMISVVEGAPEFQMAKVALIFAVQNHEVYRPMGLAYGVWDIVQDAKGLTRVVRDQHGLNLVSPVTRDVQAPSASAETELLDVVLARLKNHAALLRAPKGSH